MGSSRKAKSDKCRHQNLQVDCSPEARQSGFERAPPQKRLAAATRAGRVTANAQYATREEDFNNGQIFPGPLVLPDEALTIDPNDEIQSFKSWLLAVNAHGMSVSKRKKAIYVIPPPEVSGEVKTLMSRWTEPQVPKGEETPNVPKDLSRPKINDMCDYLASFYHLMPVKIFEPRFRWRMWTTEGKSKKKTEQRIGLEAPGRVQEVFGIRYRPSPDGIARQQLNLNDITDAMIPRVPPDAHAIVMMVDHDLYEDEEDDFCCGRAYGGSRVAIVSSFRYHPCLDYYSGIDLEHMWPASHCKAYVDGLCGACPPPTKRAKCTESPTVPCDSATPLGAAIRAAEKALVPRTKNDYDGLWFSRVARTLSHEVGHCLTLAHCVYFACVMQGTAGMAEDVRQPPYLCPVCTQKLSYSLAPLVDGVDVGDRQRAWVHGQHLGLKQFSRKWLNTGMFAGLEAWLGGRVDATPASKSQRKEIPARPHALSKKFAQWLAEDD